MIREVRMKSPSRARGTAQDTAPKMPISWTLLCRCICLNRSPEIDPVRRRYHDQINDPNCASPVKFFGFQTKGDSPIGRAQGVHGRGLVEIRMVASKFNYTPASSSAPWIVRRARTHSRCCTPSSKHPPTSHARRGHFGCVRRRKWTRATTKRRRFTPDTSQQRYP